MSKAKIPDVKKKVLKIVQNRKDELVELLQNLIRFPSTVGQEKEIQKFIYNKFKKMNLEIDMWEPDLKELREHAAFVPYPEQEKIGYKDRPIVVGKKKGIGGGKSLILEGHVDVVTPEPLNEWHYNPWGGEIDNERVYGRGACDMKAGIASMIMAMDCVQEAGIELKGDVLLESVIDEENGGSGALACVLRNYEADGGIVLEPTGSKLFPAHIGVMWFKVKVKGKAAHAAHKHTGVCAIEKGYKIYHALMNLESYRNAVLKHPLYANYVCPFAIVVGVMKAGRWRSTVADETIMEVRMGFMPGEDINEVFEKEVKGYIFKIGELDSWMKTHPPEIEKIGMMEPYEIDLSHPIIKVVANSLQKVMGKDIRIEGAPWDCDARIPVLYGNTPSVIYGPGDCNVAHAPDEFVSIEDLIKATEVVAISILRWCGYE